MNRRIGFIAASLSIILAPVFADAQWSAPSASAPSNNASTPLNVSATTQTKAGTMVVASLGSSGGGYFLGNFGVGASSPSVNFVVGNDLGALITAPGKGVVYGNSGGSFYSYTGQDSSHSLAMGWTYSATPASAYGIIQTYSRTNPLYIDASSLYLNSLSGAGNVGVGNASPAYKLDVTGSVGATAYFYTSDRSLKKDIQPLSDALAKVMKLQGVSFAWKKDGTKSVGLIAQDVEQVYPELVSTNAKTGIKSVEYGNLVGPLIEAIKTQQKEIDDLKAEIQALKK